MDTPSLLCAETQLVAGTDMFEFQRVRSFSRDPEKEKRNERAYNTLKIRMARMALRFQSISVRATPAT
jgi:hypothetical protein